MMLALREPIGVAAQIIPWNYPLLMASWKIAPALCAGRTVVLKPADAIRLANDTTYGLAAAVWTRDIFRALRTVKALKAGIVWVNDTQTSHVEGPWGGYKQSGIGRELGRWGVEQYLETKQVFINLDEFKFSSS